MTASTDVPAVSIIKAHPELFNTEPRDFERIFSLSIMADDERQTTQEKAVKQGDNQEENEQQFSTGEALEAWLGLDPLSLSWKSENEPVNRRDNFKPVTPDYAIHSSHLAINQFFFMVQSPLQFTGHLHLRTRLVLSVISGKPVRIDNIRSNDKNPGLRDFEISLLRLFEKITNGTLIEISYTGTTILIKPGVITGGTITHECPLSRSVGYFLEAVVMLAPFSKKPLNLTLKGITTDNHDLSVDLIRTVTLPHLQSFGIEDGLELRIKKRGAPPLGGGEVQFMCPIVKQVKTLNFVQPGRIKRIRGISHAVRVSPQFSNRMIDACRSVLNRYIPDIYIYSDVYKKEESGNSPGYALSLVAESTTTALHCSEAVSVPGGTPEDIALIAARALLTEIKRGGCVDSHHQSLVLLFMVLGSEDMGRVRLGELSSRTIQFLRDVRDFFGTSFKIVRVDPSDTDNQDLLLSCYGIGFVNVNKAVA